MRRRRRRHTPSGRVGASKTHGFSLKKLVKKRWAGEKVGLILRIFGFEILGGWQLRPELESRKNSSLEVGCQ